MWGTIPTQEDMKKITGTLEKFLRHNVKPEHYDEICKRGIAEWLDETDRICAEVSVERCFSICGEPFVFRINDNDIEEDINFHDWFKFQGYDGHLPDGVYLVRGENGELDVCELRKDAWIGQACERFVFKEIKLLTKENFETLV